jgi:hypothetical protein
MTSVEFNKTMTKYATISIYSVKDMHIIRSEQTQLT